MCRIDFLASRASFSDVFIKLHFYILVILSSVFSSPTVIWTFSLLLLSLICLIWNSTPRSFPLVLGSFPRRELRFIKFWEFIDPPHTPWAPSDLPAHPSVFTLKLESVSSAANFILISLACQWIPVGSQRFSWPLATLLSSHYFLLRRFWY